MSTSGSDPTINNPNGEGLLGFFRVAYSDTIRMKSQRVESQLAAVFEKEALHGAPLVIHQVKRVEEGDKSYGIQTNVNVDSVLSKNAPRAQRLLYNQVPTETREISPDFWDFAQLFDPRDEKALMRAVAPDSNFQKAVMGAFNRKIDKVIVEALDASATIDGTSTTFVNDGGLQVGVDVNQMTVLTGSANSASLTIDELALSTPKLLQARYLMEDAEAITPGERLICILSPKQHHLFLANDTKVQNFDYNAANPLGKGAVSDWLGMDFIVTTAIDDIDTADPTDGADTNPFSITAADSGAGATGQYVYVCSRDAVLVGLDEITVKFDTLPQFRHSLQVAHYSSLGAVRLDGTKICRIQCSNSTATA